MIAPKFKVFLGIAIFTVFLVVGVSTRLAPQMSPQAFAPPADETNAPRTGDQNRTDAGTRSTPRVVSAFVPAYLALHKSGELAARAQKLWSMMAACNLCPRLCGVNRLAGAVGFCRAPGSNLVIASVQPHFGEEQPLVGIGGSGTIFLSHCNLRCVFCQNYQISILGRGSQVSIQQLATAMLELQATGAHNINLVTPTHYTPHIVAAIDIAAGRGLRLPILWNTSGWERVEVLRLLDGIVDIYLPDLKFATPEDARQFSGAPAYPRDTKLAILEMHRQVGVARANNQGIINRGLMIRHLVMPNSASGSTQVLNWIAENLPRDTYVNIMQQYSPHHEAFNHPRIARRLTRDEYQSIVDLAQQIGLTNLDSRTARWLRR